ncbi:hypothetical protein GOV14_02145 [Candidatus Pacearchaeota archaeon]|nr:hypothetical protein [Candidatus Pacearchaeota archaeon]
MYPYKVTDEGMIKVARTLGIRCPKKSPFLEVNVNKGELKVNEETVNLQGIIVGAYLGNIIIGPMDNMLELFYAQPQENLVEGDAEKIRKSLEKTLNNDQNYAEVVTSPSKEHSQSVYPAITIQGKFSAKINYKNGTD